MPVPLIGLAGLVVATVATVAVGAVVLGRLGPAEQTRSDGSASRSTTDAGSVSVPPNSYTFEISGDATTVLVPGSEATLNLQLTNTGDVDLVIIELLVEVAAVDSPHANNDLPCSIADFTVRQLTPANIMQPLRAGDARTLEDLGVPASKWPTILMLNRPVNQDGCQDATLTLHYTGVGTASDA